MQTTARQTAAVRSLDSPARVTVQYSIKPRKKRPPSSPSVVNIAILTRGVPASSLAGRPRILANHAPAVRPFWPFLTAGARATVQACVHAKPCNYDAQCKAAAVSECWLREQHLLIHGTVIWPQ